MKFAYTILYVLDVAKTITFYKDCFGFQEKFITPKNDYAELLSGETTIAFANLELSQKNLKSKLQISNQKNAPFGIELAFTTDNIEDDFQKAIDAGAILEVPITTKSWGQKVGYVRDINGFLIEICTPING